MQLLLNKTFFTVPTFSLKPLLFVTLGGVTGISVYSSLILRHSEGREKVIATLKGAISPFINTARNTVTGLTKMYTPLSEWAKVVANQQDTVIGWITNIDIGPAKISDGSRLIYNKLKDWVPKTVGIVAIVLKTLFEEPSKFRDKIYHFSPLLWNAFSALNSPYGTENAWALRLIDIVGHEKFGQFAKIIADNSDLISQLKSDEVEAMINAFEGAPDIAVKLMEELAKDPSQDKQEILDKIKPFALIGEIKNTNKEAAELIEEAKVRPSKDKSYRAEQVFSRLKELEAKLEDTIKKATKDFLSKNPILAGKIKKPVQK